MCGVGMDHLGRLPALESLNLGYTGIGNRGVAALGAASRLAALNLDSCDITDGCGAAASDRVEGRGLCSIA